MPRGFNNTVYATFILYSLKIPVSPPPPPKKKRRKKEEEEVTLMSYINSYIKNWPPETPTQLYMPCFLNTLGGLMILWVVRAVIYLCLDRDQLWMIVINIIFVPWCNKTVHCDRSMMAFSQYNCNSSLTFMIETQNCLLIPLVFQYIDEQNMQTKQLQLFNIIYDKVTELFVSTAHSMM